jgi:hypothetical protein
MLYFADPNSGHHIENIRLFYPNDILIQNALR